MFKVCTNNLNYMYRLFYVIKYWIVSISFFTSIIYKMEAVGDIWRQWRPQIK
jgi:hypothetical protein